MPRLTAELIADSPQFTNAVKDWELDLRGKGAASKFMCIFCRGPAGYMCSHSHALSGELLCVR